MELPSSLIDRKGYIERIKPFIRKGIAKVLTGQRRVGKSFLLFTLFTEYLKANGIPDDHIVQIALEDDLNEKYRDPHELSKYILEHFFICLFTRICGRNPVQGVRQAGDISTLLQF